MYLVAYVHDSETVLAEMGVALRDDSTLVGVFSPRKVSICLHFYYFAILICIACIMLTMLHS